MPSPCPAGRTRSTIDAQAGAWGRLQSAVPGAGLIDVVWPTETPSVNDRHRAAEGRSAGFAVRPSPRCDSPGSGSERTSATTSGKGRRHPLSPRGTSAPPSPSPPASQPEAHRRIWELNLPSMVRGTVIAPVTRAMRLAQGPEAIVIRASRSSERDPEDAADAGVSLMNAQVRHPARIDPSARPAERTETRRTPAPRHKHAGQAPLSAGSRIATHSTCDVIGNRSNTRSIRTRYPPSRKYPRSRASAAGSQAT
ncbi:hypothetical protein RKD29_005601 [Streptomyces tendae]